MNMNYRDKKKFFFASLRGGFDEPRAQRDLLARFAPFGTSIKFRFGYLTSKITCLGWDFMQ